MIRLSTAAASTSTRCGQRSNDMLSQWKALYEATEEKGRDTDNMLTAAAFHWPYLMACKREVLAFEGTDRRFGKLGINPIVDMRRMKCRAEKR